MKKFFRTALVIGFVLSASFVRSQAGPPPATAAASPESAPPTVPPDQQPTKQQLAKLFEVMQIRRQVGAVMQVFPVMIQQQVRQQEKEIAESQPESARMTPEQQAALDKVTDRYLEKAMNLYPVDEMLDDMAAIYQRHFTREDVGRLHRVLLHARGKASVANDAGHHAGVHAGGDAARPGAKQGAHRGNVKGYY